MILTPHSQRIERFLGPELAEGLSRKTRGWYGPPIPIIGTGLVVGGDGAYRGRLMHGGFASMADFATERFLRIARNAGRRSLYKAHTGFSSLSDLISEATTGGKSQSLHYSKTGAAAPAVAASMHLWKRAALPVAGANSAGPGGGTVPGRATAGGFQQADPGGTDTLHLTTWTGLSTVVGAVLLSDFIFGVNINHATTPNVITGVPTRYQGTNAAGTFLSALVTTGLNATAHNITVTYVDQDGNAAEAGAAQAIRVSSAADEIPFTAPQWFYNLNSPDTGLRNITNVAFSAAPTGNVDWQLLHALAILPCPVAGVPFILDGINSAFNLVQVLANACLVLTEYFKTATTAATVSGMIQAVAG
jgi:hypothetical protein